MLLALENTTATYSRTQTSTPPNLVTRHPHLSTPLILPTPASILFNTTNPTLVKPLPTGTEQTTTRSLLGIHLLLCTPLPTVTFFFTSPRVFSSHQNTNVPFSISCTIIHYHAMLLYTYIYLYRGRASNLSIHHLLYPSLLLLLALLYPCFSSCHLSSTPLIRFYSVRFLPLVGRGGIEPRVSVVFESVEVVSQV